MRTSATTSPIAIPPSMATRLTWMVRATPLSRNGQYCKTCPNDDRAVLPALKCKSLCARSEALRAPGGSSSSFTQSRRWAAIRLPLDKAIHLRSRRHVLRIAVLDDRGVQILLHRINHGLQECR